MGAARKIASCTRPMVKRDLTICVQAINASSLIADRSLPNYLPWRAVRILNGRQRRRRTRWPGQTLKQVAMRRAPVAAGESTRNAAWANDRTMCYSLSFSLKKAMVRFQASWAACLLYRFGLVSLLNACLASGYIYSL